MIQIKRAYDPPGSRDGFRVLVERLWPRGVSKDRAAVDLWLKEVAPSTELRKWFAHDPAKWGQFKRRYWKELGDQPEAIAMLKAKSRRGRVTFVYAAKDEQHNGALALKEFIEKGKK